MVCRRTRGSVAGLGLRRPWLALLLLLSLVGVSNASAVEGDDLRIDRIKAAFVLNIARFVTWPPQVFEGDAGELQLCLYRRDPLGEGVDEIRGKRVGGRALQVRLIDDLEASNSCHILVIAQQEYSHYKRAQAGSRSRPLLTIADMTGEGGSAGLSRPGVLITLVRKETRIGIEVDLHQSRAAGLQLSSHLLKLARIVGEEG